ncbi:hypothetical protein H9Q10_04540 [Eikenella sp. S3360]|uniref:Lipoprotein n=1 Tax=Eikenella glucosivorans TaxID=2766967 RepID=A0ABS0N9F8_9NEIS|nr:hypothetical protein [Eikenella glucosivorans]MBH5328934.1 hypothetical protein [Eikenella glucosivorans]
MNKWMVTALAAVGLLAGCGGQEAGKGAFQDAVERYVGQHEACLPVALDTDGSAPVWAGAERIALPLRDAEGEKINEAAFKQLRALEEAGLYERLKTENGDDVPVFALTAEGRGHVRMSPIAPLLCIGHERVAKVRYYTEPATTADGLTVSRVVYEARLEPSRWGKRLLRHGRDDWRQRLPLEREEQATLVKTNDGWRDLRELPPQ